MMVVMMMLMSMWMEIMKIFEIQAMRFPPKSYNKDLESAEVRRFLSISNSFYHPITV